MEYRYCYPISGFQQQQGRMRMLVNVSDRIHSKALSETCRMFFQTLNSCKLSYGVCGPCVPRKKSNVHATTLWYRHISHAIPVPYTLCTQTPPKCEHSFESQPQECVSPFLHCSLRAVSCGISAFLHLWGAHGFRATTRPFFSLESNFGAARFQGNSRMQSKTDVVWWPCNSRCNKKLPMPQLPARKHLLQCG